MAPHVARQMQVTGALARHWNAVDVQGADDAPSRPAANKAGVRGPGGAPLQPMPRVRAARAGCRAVRDSTLVAWYRSIYAPRTGGAYDSHHRTAGIDSRARRRGGRVAACSACAAGADKTCRCAGGLREALAGI